MEVAKRKAQYELTVEVAKTNAQYGLVLEVTKRKAQYKQVVEVTKGKTLYELVLEVSKRETQCKLVVDERIASKTQILTQLYLKLANCRYNSEGKRRIKNDFQLARLSSLVIA